MKELKDLRLPRDFTPHEVSSSVKYFKKMTIDWDVFLPTRNMNLQRDFVWTLDQKRELIWSVLIGRGIPHMAFISIPNERNISDERYLVIDGKQRLSTLFDFTEDKFTLICEGTEYLFSELPLEYQQAINNFYFRYYLINEPYNNPITDDQKISWFRFINFAGTPQDKEHLSKLL